MAKSTAMPMNRMAKATETRFSVPTARAANPLVSVRPSSRVSRMGMITRQLPTARNSHRVISATAADAAPHDALGDGGELLVRQRHRTGDADMSGTIAHEFQPGRSRAQREP